MPILYGPDDPILQMLQAIAQASATGPGMVHAGFTPGANPLETPDQRPARGPSAPSSGQPQGPAASTPSGPSASTPSGPQTGPQAGAPAGNRFQQFLQRLDPNAIPLPPYPSPTSPVKRPFGGALESLAYAIPLFLKTAASQAQAPKRERERVEEREIGIAGERARTEQATAAAGESKARTGAIEKETSEREATTAANVATISAMTPEAREAIFGPGTANVPPESLARSLSATTQITSIRASQKNLDAIEESIAASKLSGKLGTASEIRGLEDQLSKAVESMTEIERDIAISQSLALAKDDPQRQALLAANPLGMAGLSIEELTAHKTILQGSIDRIIASINKLDPSLAGPLKSRLIGAAATSGVSDDAMRAIFAKAGLTLPGATAEGASDREGPTTGDYRQGMMDVSNVTQALGAPTPFDDTVDAFADTATFVANMGQKGVKFAIKHLDTAGIKEAKRALIKQLLAAGRPNDPDALDDEASDIIATRYVSRMPAVGKYVDKGEDVGRTSGGLQRMIYKAIAKPSFAELAKPNDER